MSKRQRVSFASERRVREVSNDGFENSVENASASPRATAPSLTAFTIEDVEEYLARGRPHRIRLLGQLKRLALRIEKKSHDPMKQTIVDTIRNSILPRVQSGDDSLSVEEQECLRRALEIAEQIRTTGVGGGGTRRLSRTRSKKTRRRRQRRFRL